MQILKYPSQALFEAKHPESGVDGEALPARMAKKAGSLIDGGSAFIVAIDYYPCYLPSMHL